MNQTPGWWDNTSAAAWHDVLAFINASRHCGEPFQRCERLFAALDKSWTAFVQGSPSLTDNVAHVDRSGSSDAHRCMQLFQQACSPALHQSLVMSDAVRDLAQFSPPIMDESVMPQCIGEYGDVSAAIREQAATTHSRLSEAYERSQADSADTEKIEILMESLGRVLDLARCNFTASDDLAEVTTQGRVERDRRAARIISDVVDEYFEHVFAFPSRRLAVYGTLAPGEMNAHLLAEVAGDWGPADVRGRFGRRYGYPIFSWDPLQPVRAIQVLTSPTLREHWPRLDEFEGEHYRRILVPVEMDGGTAVCNIYESAEPV